MKIEGKIREIVESMRDFILANHTCIPDQKGVDIITEEDFDKAISSYIKDLTNLFKSYARSLVPAEKKVVSDFPFEILMRAKQWNVCHEEMLRRIEEG